MAITLAEKYEQERKKRQDVSKGLSQFLGKEGSAEFSVTLREDPWIQTGTPVHLPVPNGGNVKIVVVGAGFAGVLAAIKCLEAGAAKSPEDILIVDPAGGFGGTWYWNRYPGLMCDVESYIYLPLLEETGYVPTRRYASGEEILGYFNLLVDKWGLRHRAMFQSAAKAATWDVDHWVCEIVGQPKGGTAQAIKIHADYLFIGTGAFTYPKVPNTPGIKTFTGQMLHTGRWDYNITGGSPANPVLDKLRDKSVAIVGTGATAIQCVPEVAKYAKELYVYQRTPSAVDFRGNRDTDANEWKTKIATKKGWQDERAANLQIFTEQSRDLPENMVNDGFSTMPTIAATFGGPSEVKPEDTAKHLAELQALDDARSDQIRQRAMDIVKDAETAKKLQAWYPGWCKRPCFHDEYLPTFNQPNVHLVDTEGQGLDEIRAKSIVVAGQEYPADVIIWSTGYGNPLTESLAGKAEMAVKGRTGEDMEELSKQMSLLTLHGVLNHGFPNLFTTALAQAGVGVNQVQRIEEQSKHNAHIIVEAERKVGAGKKAIIEATAEACNKWGDELASYAHLTSGILACTPGYFTLEGDVERIPPEVLGKMARTGLYGQGYMAYKRVLDDWRAQGALPGLAISAA